MGENLSRRRTACIVLILSGIIISAILLGPMVSNPEDASLDVLEGSSIAVYFDLGVSNPSYLAVIAMMKWMGATVTTIGPDHIRNGSLTSFDMLLMPGGLYSDERCQILQESDMDTIRQFVADGGAYLGIEGGASYVTAWRANMFHGNYLADANGTGIYLLSFDMNQECTEPDLSEEPASYTMLYKNSGYFSTDDWTGVTVVCTYQDTGYAAMLVFQYGDGKLFLTSAHPEFEEGDDRDGTDYYDQLHDPDSEWPFMLKICLWLL
ncbi:MAG: BPL-N domain-containing protein, partial [Candidatus Thorarchaeota archaeon]